MNCFVNIGFLVAAFLQVEGRSLGANDQMSPMLDETMQQSFACGIKIGPEKAPQIPQIREIEQLPENNSALNELWGCIWEKKGIIDEQAVLNEDKLEQYLVDLVSMFGTAGSEELEAAHDMVQQCKDVHGHDYGQTAVKIKNCIYNCIQQKF